VLCYCAVRGVVLSIVPCEVRIYVILVYDTSHTARYDLIIAQLVVRVKWYCKVRFCALCGGKVCLYWAVFSDVEAQSTWTHIWRYEATKLCLYACDLLQFILE
jgi:hypothetical protein